MMTALVWLGIWLCCVGISYVKFKTYTKEERVLWWFIVLCGPLTIFLMFIWFIIAEEW